MNQKQLGKERERNRKAEITFLNQNMHRKVPAWQEKISRFVPEKLDGTLKTAFFKAFELIFEKGTGIIEKTYNKEKKQQDYKIREFAAETRNNCRSVREFGRQAAVSKGVNMAISTVEGVGMGVLGMGLPDIPLFIGVLLKSIYEIALTYGFSYDSEEERIFILKMIETALSHEEELIKRNMELNSLLETGLHEENLDVTLEEQIRRTSDVLAEEMLYLKFIQGAPVVGVVGGISDLVYQKKILDFVGVKYKKRFLEKQQNTSRESQS